MPNDKTMPLHSLNKDTTDDKGNKTPLYRPKTGCLVHLYDPTERIHCFVNSSPTSDYRGHFAPFCACATDSLGNNSIEQRILILSNCLEKLTSRMVESKEEASISGSHQSELEVQQ